MAQYVLQHFSASATREHMQDVTDRFGNITVTGYEPATLHVEADPSVIRDFEKMHKSWIVKQAP